MLVSHTQIISSYHFMQRAMDSGVLANTTQQSAFLAAKSSVPQPEAAELAQQYLVMPHTWQHTKEGGRHAVNIGQKFDLAERLGTVGNGLYYQLLETSQGVVDVDGVGKKRLARLIGHWNPRGVKTTVINFPGFAHTHLYEDATWFMKILAEIAHHKQCNFLCVDIMGRGLPGFDRSERISRLGLAESIADTNKVSDTFLSYIAAESDLDIQDLDVVARGHSLGAKFARHYARHIINQTNGPTLVGMIQEAPIAAGRLEDLTSPGFVWTLMPLTWPLLLGLSGNRAGMEITMAQQRGFFYGSVEGSRDNLIVAALGQQRAEVRSLVEALIGKGDLANHLEITQYLRNGINAIAPLVGSHIIYPADDAIFSRGVSSDQMVADARGGHTIYNPAGMPHCYLPANPTTDLINGVRSTYQQIFGISDKSSGEQL